MIARIRGEVVEKTPNAVIVEAGGLGYELSVTAEDHGSMAIGSEAVLYVYENIREDAYGLYGFRDRASQAFFEQLLTISGIGPKVALGVLSAAPLPQLQAAIVAGDPEVLRGVAGIGKKTAERIMVELRGKVAAVSGLNQEGSVVASVDPAYQALLGLGYTAVQAAEAVRSIPADVTGEQERVKAALKQLG